MTDQWVEQTATALVAVHLLAAALVAAAIVVASRVHRACIRWHQAFRVRIAVAMWLTRSSALASREDGQATTGAGTPDPAPVVVLPRTRVQLWPEVDGGRHRLQQVA